MKLEIPTRLLPRSTNWDRERVYVQADQWTCGTGDINREIGKVNYFVTKDFKKHSGTWVYALLMQMHSFAKMNSPKNISDFLQFLWFEGKGNFKLKSFIPITNRPLTEHNEVIDKISDKIWNNCLPTMSLGHTAFVQRIADDISDEIVWDKPTNVFAKNYKSSMSGNIIKKVLKNTDRLMYFWIRTIDNPITDKEWETSTNVEHGIYQNIFHCVQNNYEPKGSFLQDQSFSRRILDYIEKDYITNNL